MSGPSILLLHEVTVSFDGFRALNALSLDIEEGELRCIIGPNGAGKTTMMDVITGKTRADRGKVMFDQNIDVRRMSEPEIAHLGIGRKFQKPTIFENLTVFENLELSMKTDKRARTSLFAWLDDDARDKIAATLRLIRLDTEADRQAGLLSHGQKQWLEIGMLLMQDPKLLLLDETGGRHDRRRDGTHRRVVQVAGRQALPWWWSSTTWPSSNNSAAWSRCCTRVRCWPKVTLPRCRTTSGSSKYIWVADDA